jgi:hypothetical protein
MTLAVYSRTRVLRTVRLDTIDKRSQVALGKLKKRADHRLAAANPAPAVMRRATAPSLRLKSHVPSSVG